MNTNKTHIGNALDILKTFPDQWVNCIVTSPPYFGLRDYDVDLQVGLERTPTLYVERLVSIFEEAKRVLRDDGTLWIVIGDSYVGGKGQSGSKGSDCQDERHQSGESMNTAQQTLGGQKMTRPTDDRQMMKDENLKPKDLIGIPWRLAFALQQKGWYLRSDIIWSKPSSMPESVKDRVTRSHEYVFMLTKSSKYYYDQDAIRVSYEGRPLNRWGGSKMKRVKGKMKEYLDIQNVGNTSSMREGRPIRPNEKGSNKRSVWTVNTKVYPNAHFAVYPEELIEPCILAGCPENGLVLDPFMGSGTTAQVALLNSRNSVGIELNPEYETFINERMKNISHILTARENLKTWFDIEKG